MIEQLGLILGAALVGGYLYRWRGGGWPKSRKAWPSWARGIHRFLRVGLFGFALCWPLWVLAPWWVAFLAGALTTGAVSLGHGNYLDYGHHGPEGESDDPTEFWNFIVHRLTDARDGAWHDGLGMAISGVSYLLPLGVALAILVDPWFGLVALAGALKALAYGLGWFVWEMSRRDVSAIVVAELVAGGLLLGAVTAAAVGHVL
jgi:hypothetical protein